MPDVYYLSAVEQARLVRRRELSAVELLEAHLARIHERNPGLNAVVTLDEAGARTAAVRADAALDRAEAVGPLHGVPFTVKDCIETAGLRTTAGHEPLAEYVPARDAPAVARLRAAGGVLLGKTNPAALATGAESVNPVFGRTNNPWDLTRSPGGSTGGGAAAVAAGLSPLELGSDAGGSVRIPAHFCGVLALKPTEHRVPFTGHIPELPGQPRGLRHLAVLGPLARNVADLELAIGMLAGPDGQQWEVPPVPFEPAARPAWGDLRLAWAADVGGLPVSEDTRSALTTLAAGLDGAGARVEQAVPPGFDFTEAYDVGLGMFNAEVPRTPEPQPGEREVTMRQYTGLLARRDVLIEAFERFLAGRDAWLCPVMGTPAWTHRALGEPVSVDGAQASYWRTAMGHCIPFNLTGHPVVVMPVGVSREGLPIGVQVVGRRWGEAQLLAVCARLEELVGPPLRPPGY